MRRYDLDWLRVIVFSLLIFYHVGMFFVPWGFHIKNNVIYDILKWPMLFLNQWRLPILFVISGMGTRYALSKRSAMEFSLERISRLLLPLIFGMLFIIPPQVYFERLAKNEFSGNYNDFWPWEAFSGVYPMGNLSWHHLWFLPYLLVFSLILLPAFLFLRNNPGGVFLGWVRKISYKPASIYLFILPLFLIALTLEPLFPVTHALTDDWFTFFYYLVLFFYGYVLISAKEVFWQMVQNNRRIFLVNGLVGFILLIGIWISLDDSPTADFMETMCKVYNTWSWILALFGYAAQYLNRPSRGLVYCNEAVYSFYILHQTIMILIAYYLMDLQWGFFSKAFLMVSGTFAGSYLLYEYIIRRIKFIRPLFGLKSPIKTKEKTRHEAGVIWPSR